MIELNKVYNMDNLELLKQIDDESIDLIYSDILYGTGRKFKDYTDIKADKDIVYNFYLPRIIEIHRTLKNTGTIYLQMDCRISHWIRCLMDEVFGYKNFKNEIYWKKGVPRGARKYSKKFANISDVILMYTKTDENIWNPIYEPKNYNKLIKYDENGRPFTLKAIDDYSEESLENFEKQGLIYITKNKKRRIISYIDEDKGKLLSNIWTDINPCNYQTKEWASYDTQKPKALLERIIKASSNEGDVVADFFCGSGTTMVVAKELNRQYIGCDINPRAIEITNKRLEEIN